MLVATLLALGVAGAIGGREGQPLEATPAPTAKASAGAGRVGAKARAPRASLRRDASAAASPRSAFLPPATGGDRVPAAPFVVMLASMVVLLLSTVPARLLADVRLPSPDRARAIAVLAGCSGLLLALVVLLASA